MPKRRPRLPLAPDGRLAQPFQALAALTGSLPQQVLAPAPPPAQSPAPPQRQHYHVHSERKGRGGKAVTLVGGLQLPHDALMALAQAMRRQLGCGVVVQQSILVVQGDQAERVRSWLAKHVAGTTP